MAGADLAFTIIARDVNAERTFKKVGDAASKAGRQISKDLKKSSDDSHPSLKKLGDAAQTAGKQFAKMTGYTIIAAGAISLLGQIMAALPPLAIAVGGAFAMLPALVLAAVVAFGALKLATRGVGDAMKAAFGPADKFEEALAKLSPVARQFALEVRALAPALKALQQTVQDSFFGAFAGQLTNAANVLVGPMKAGLSNVADGLGSIVFQVLALAQTPKAVAGLKTLMDNIGDAIWAIQPAVQPLIAALGTLAVVGSSFLGPLAAGLAGAAAKFGEFVNQAAASGGLATFFETAGTIAGQLFGLLVKLGSVLGSIMQAATAGGANLFDSIGKVLGALDALLSSAEGQQALTGLFQAAGAVMTSLTPIITTLLSVLAPVATVLLQSLADGLALLAPAAQPVAQAIGAVALALAPLLPLIGAELANILVVAAGLLSALAAELGPLLRLSAEYGVAMATKLLPPLMQLIQAGLPVAVKLGAALADAITPLIPLIMQVGEQFISALIPAMQEMLPILSGQLLPAIVQLAQAMVGNLMVALLEIIPILPDLVESGLTLIQAFLQMYVAMLPVIPLLIEISAFMMRVIVHTGLLKGLMYVLVGAVYVVAAGFASAAGIIKALIWVFQHLWQWTGQLATAIGTGLVAAFNFFKALPGQIISALTALPGQLWALFSNALLFLATAIGTGLGTILRFFLDLPGNIWNALLALPGLLGSLWTWAWSTAKEAVINGWNAVWGFLTGIPGALLSLGGWILDAFTGAWNAAWEFLTGLPGKALNLGGDIISGLINGVQAAAGRLWQLAKDMASNFLQGFKDALLSSSPSRKFMAEGHNIVSGLVLGVRGKMTQVVETSHRLADATMGGFPVHTATAAAYAGGGFAQSRGPTVLELRSSGSEMDNFLVDLLRRVIDDRGGSVQTVLGRRG